MIRIGRSLPKVRWMRPTSNRSWIITSLIIIAFVIGIHKTFHRYKSDDLSELTLTILTAIKGSSDPDYIHIDSSGNHIWQKKCGGNVNIINHKVLLLRDGTLFGHFIDAKRTGGDDVLRVIGQPENDEFVRVNKGFIRVPCDDVVLPKLYIQSTYQHFIKTIDITTQHQKYGGTTEQKYLQPFGIVVERKDYANVYWTMIELYNAFLTTKMFSRDPSQTCIVVLDVHPRGKLDELWSMVFQRVIRVKEIKDQEVNFRDLIFGIDTYSGPITAGMELLPFIYEFQETIYRANALCIPAKTPCSLGSQYLNITLILRNNYVAHARNPSGKIKRKLLNEEEIINEIRSAMPSTKLTAVQLDDLSMEDQVKLIYNTDILIGVHGAGLGHVIMMRPQSGLIELFPTLYFLFRNKHFEEFANWVGVHYSSWYNCDVFFGDSEWLYVPPKTVVQLLQEMTTKICSGITLK
ncbi:beta-(1,2)-xylosyltransferase-like [Mizuhopecten yessoensis]|uniref:EGF domain-specific O-linked N-acetylglucosamine transferase n=1 Tax=Mizuhopecten yessoensis TaxID=6573 RepID=A0A210Q635_MIZYE|nr:beta-(1,2)-xylosyltransferase-like [Mizuhopecten yessoensis]XP_021366223.1 beta-(1,2)-xylosyltransferase-like [Mizuhopecten yessoensis]XP_021366224.1 beta-(1,2)-xylosyltransferase-like [Mizuhopecten yessoensis]OWF44197.1 Beta-(1,2)-xylosyltransferase [Mizuhopecten yessoensis]